MKTLFATALAATLALPLAVSAATVTIEYQAFAGSQATASANARTARDAFIDGPAEAGEDFEGFIACPAVGCASGEISTGVGTFTGIMPAQAPSPSGESQVAPTNQIVVRTSSPDPFGRFNVTESTEAALAANWLDSNDMTGIMWTLTAKPGHVFKAIAFMLTDLDDVGTVRFGISANGETLVTRDGAASIPNAALHLVKMSFEGRVTNLQISMLNGIGDGFGFDGARIDYAPVPVPAAGLLLLGALGGLAALRRRKA